MVEVRQHKIAEDTQHPPPDERAPVAQWVGLFLAPAIFFAHLEVAYVLIPWACVRHGDAWMHIVSALATGIALIGTIVARRAWERTKDDGPDDAGGAVPRTRFVAIAGLGMSGLFTLLLFAQWAAAFVISPCQ